jgi:hypothetical protein
MARRYTITDVTTQGSGVRSFRDAIIGSTTPGSANKGFSDDSRMKAMFPKSPLYIADDLNDTSIIDNFKSLSIDITTQSSYDFSSTQPAYMNFGHPQAPNLTMISMNTPVSGADYDKPYYGHPNLQVNSIDPLDERTVVTGTDGGLLRVRKNEDGGFGTKNNLKNYATSEVRTSIGQYFSKIYTAETNSESQALGKINSMGNSTMQERMEGSPSEVNGNLSSGINNFRVQSST